ncbi:hypothetical protein JL721_8963 [Aureococcus anophagefferens]|nr:hypothetical protein JL721_8963 [Aureococcus anophagefferens]
MAERLDGVARLDDATRTAAARGDGETVRLLASRGGKVGSDGVRRHGRDYACGRGSKEAVRACLDAGADALGDALGLGEIFVTKKNARTLVKETPEKVLNPTSASRRVAKVALDRSGQSLSQAALSHSASAKSGELRGYTEAEALAGRNSASERPVDTAHQRGRRSVIIALNDAWDEFKAAEHPPIVVPSPPPSP